MTRIKHDIWKNKEGLTSLHHADSFGLESRSLLEPGSEIIYSFYADSHFDAMTQYYTYMDWGVYESEFKLDHEPYNLQKIKNRINRWIEQNQNTLNRIKDIDDLFFLFHDFDIVGLSIDDHVLSLETLIPWCEMWDIEEYKMTFRFYGCSEIECHYWKRTSNELKTWKEGVYYPSEEHVTNDLNEILKLELDIQRHDFNPPNFFTLHCNSPSSQGSNIGGIEYAEIKLNTSGYQIFDHKMNELKLDQLKNWATEWQNEILRK